MSKNFLYEGFILNGGQHPYRIVRVLGHGGFGITYLAQTRVSVGNINITAQFAIKEHFLKADCERDATTSRVQCSGPAQERVDTSRKDFLAEARRLHKVGVTHPNIVRVNEVFEANNTAYYVMEYLDGESLAAYVRRKGPLPEAEALAIMRPIASAVAAIHANRMTHLDIKPANIMLVTDEDGNLRPVLIDFGLSKHYDESGEPTSTINIQGFSDGYAPIEQYMGITTFSPRSDIYALGATLYFCLTGQKPGKPDELAPGELAASLPAGVSAATRSIVEQATRLVKSQRPEDAAALFGTTGKAEESTPADESTQILDEATRIAEKSDNSDNSDKSERSEKSEKPATPASDRHAKKSPKKWLIAGATAIILAVVGVIALLFIPDKKATEVAAPEEEVAENTTSSETKVRNEQAVANLKAGNEAVQNAIKVAGFKMTRSGIAYSLFNGKELNPPRNVDDLQLTLDYEMSKLDGTVLEKQEDIVLTGKDLKPGIAEALSLLQIGEGGLFYIPGELAFGEKGVPQAGIGPMEMLIFDVRLKDINPNK